MRRAGFRSPPGLTVLERLMLRVEYELNTGCWLWSGGTNGAGYGNIAINNRARMTHRVSFEAKNGPIPPGMFVCHRCDTPPCINPDHLFLGTHADNMADKRAKRRGRGLRGERHPLARLSDGQVLEIYALKGVTPQPEIARRYGIAASMVSYIHAGKRRLTNGIAPGEALSSTNSPGSF